jgi:hypothetical protein
MWSHFSLCLLRKNYYHKDLIELTETTRSLLDHRKHHEHNTIPTLRYTTYTINYCYVIIYSVRYKLLLVRIYKRNNSENNH